MVNEKSIDKETAKQIQELQLAEQGIQNLMMQKQAFLLESNETEMLLKNWRKAPTMFTKLPGR
ncbi:MAG: hypothetical protein V1660_04015 [archaeon]